MNKNNITVLRKILYAVESGGQVYGNYDYSCFCGVGANTDNEKAITIGAGQWYGVEACRLLRDIRDADEALFYRLDGAGIASDLKMADWEHYAVTEASAKGQAIIKLISTNTGIRCQDALMDEQVAEYAAYINSKYGVTDDKAMMEWINIIHQGGEGAVIRLMGKCTDRNNLDAVYQSMENDTGNQVGAYRSRQQAVYKMIKQYAEEGTSMGTIDKAVDWTVGIANDDSHGYAQDNRWGPDYDCSSLVISAWQQAGVPVKTKGATYTGNMREVFLRCGFGVLTHEVNLATGRGLKRGDVLLNEVHHTAMVVKDNGSVIVQASINEHGGVSGGRVGDQTGREIWTRDYYNYPWDCVLRYTKDTANTTPAYDGRNVERAIGRCKKSTWYVREWAGKENAKIKSVPALKTGMLMYIMDYDQYDKSGQKWHFVKLQHPTIGWVYGFVLASGIQIIKKM